MIQDTFKRITVDIQIPEGFELSKEGRKELAAKTEEFAQTLGKEFAKEKEGGIVVSNFDTLKNHHSMVVVVGFRPEKKKGNSK